MTDTEEKDLEAFSWLTLDRWNVDSIFNFHTVSGKKLCKICDKWVAEDDQEKHVKSHVKKRKAIIQRNKEEALERAREARVLRKKERELAKQQKENND